MDREFPKVLVISHNVFSRTMNVGRFLADTFRDWPSEKLSQMYFYDETPTVTLCTDYYKVTDRDVLGSIMRPGKICGHVLSEKDIDASLGNSVSGRMKESNLYRFKNRHEKLAKLLREAAWGTGVWKTRQLDEWIRKTSPDVIYYVMSDYVFPFKIVEYLSEKYDIPVFVSIDDDYYFNFPVKGLFDRIRRYKYRRNVEMIMDRSFGVSYACDIMKDQYEEQFRKDGIIQFKSAVSFPAKEQITQHKKFLYAGSMSFGRWKSLLEIGKNLEPYDAELRIYSNTDDGSILEELGKCSSIRFMGFAPAEKIEEEIKASDVLLVVESFDRESIERVRCSLSTKIGDYVGANRCILACGPKEVGSIDYLLRNEAAVVSDYEGLADAIDLIINRPEEARRYTDNAMKLAEENHDSGKITDLLYRELSKATLADRN